MLELQSEVQQLPAFYEAIAEDSRIGNTHICLYIALLSACGGMAFPHVIDIDRDGLMKNARVSRKTYHKCMRELQAYGYIKYYASPNPAIRSRASLNRL